MEELPVLLSIGIDQSKSDELVTMVANRLLISDSCVGKLDNVRKLDNIYYCAEIRLNSLNRLNADVNDLYKNVEVILFYIDHEIVDPVPELKKWIEKGNNSIETKILIYNDNDSSQVNESVQQWCTKYNCELINLLDTVETKNNDSIIEEKFGIDRVIEVLHTHQWSNLIMKKKDEFSSKNKDADLSSNVPGEDLTNDFENMQFLFQNLLAMKQTLASLNPTERTEKAGKIAQEFLRAMGGDEGEDSDSDGEIIIIDSD